MSRKMGRIGIFMMAVTAVAFMAAIFAAPVIAAEKSKSKAMTISGTVVEMTKDKKGVVTSVGIKTEKEGDFTVAKKGKGADLMKMVNKKVEVTGAVHEAKGKKTINVTEYKVME